MRWRVALAFPLPCRLSSSTVTSHTCGGQGPRQMPACLCAKLPRSPHLLALGVVEGAQVVDAQGSGWGAQRKADGVEEGRLPAAVWP